MRNLTACLLAGVSVAVLAMPAIATAQPATTGTKMATERGAQGTAARDAANFEKAMIGVGQAYKAPRASDGHADLQGFWNNSTLTGLERPAAFGERKELHPRKPPRSKATKSSSTPTRPSPWTRTSRSRICWPWTAARA